MTTGAAEGRFGDLFPRPFAAPRGAAVFRGRAASRLRCALHGRTKRSRAAARWRAGMQGGGESPVGEPTGGRRCFRYAESPWGDSGWVATASDGERGRGHPANVAQGGLGRIRGPARRAPTRRSVVSASSRVLPLTLFVGVDDVMRALDCSRSKAYALLREAAGRRLGGRGMRRVPAFVWETFIREKLQCQAPLDRGLRDGDAPGTERSTSGASVTSGRRSAPTERPPRRSSRSGNVTVLIPIVRPRTRPQIGRAH